MFFTDFGGSVYGADLDGSNQRTLLYALGNLSGIAYGELTAGPRPDGAQAVKQRGAARDD